jgi:hypothetical protein
MITIQEQWEAQPSGQCTFGGNGTGWYQRLEQFKAVLNVRLTQRRFLNLAEYNTRLIRAKVDTGSYYTVIDWGLFLELGYRVSTRGAVDLGITGVVQDPDGPSTLLGWRERMRICPEAGGNVRLPMHQVDVLVAKNVKERKCLVGLEFLNNYPLILKDGLLVLMGQTE